MEKQGEPLKPHSDWPPGYDPGEPLVGYIRASTDKSWGLVSYPEEKKVAVWVPKSACACKIDLDEETGHVILCVKKWLYKSLKSSGKWWE